MAVGTPWAWGASGWRAGGREGGRALWRLRAAKVVQMTGDDGERLRSSEIWTLARHPWPRWLPHHSVTCRLDPMT